MKDPQPLFTGATTRNRTGDLRITSALLYQLSYGGWKTQLWAVKITSDAALVKSIDRAGLTGVLP